MRTVNKPWGREVWFAQHPKYLAKLIRINAGHRLSKQYHRFKHETILVIRGPLRLEIGSRKRRLNQGSICAIAPRTVHRFCAPSADVLLLEVSTGQSKDVIRLEDDYGRVE